MTNPSYEQALKDRGIDKNTTPLTFEAAESFMEATRPSFLGQENAEKRDHRFHFIALRMLDEGETLPLSIAHAETLEGREPTITRTLKQWHAYWALAAAELAGIPSDIDPRKV